MFNCYFVASVSFVYVVSVCVAAINIAIDCEDEPNLLNCLQSSCARLCGVTPKCVKEYLRQLRIFKEEKEKSGVVSIHLLTSEI